MGKGLWQLSKHPLTQSQNQAQFRKWYQELQEPENNLQLTSIKHKILIIIYLMLLLKGQNNIFINTFLLIIFPYTFTITNQNQQGFNWKNPTTITLNMIKTIFLQLFVLGLGNMLIGYIYHYICNIAIISYSSIVLFILSQSPLTYLSLYVFSYSYFQYINSSIALALVVYCQPKYEYLNLKLIGLSLLLVMTERYRQLGYLCVSLLGVKCLQTLDRMLNKYKSKHRNFCKIIPVQQYY